MAPATFEVTEAGSEAIKRKVLAANRTNDRQTEPFALAAAGGEISHPPLCELSFFPTNHQTRWELAPQCANGQLVSNLLSKMQRDTLHMEHERSLETILAEVRSKYATPIAFKQYHREFLDPLRDGNWVRSSKLPDMRRTRLTLLRNGWIERRETASMVDYRITESGLAALVQPR
ncbi:hypothetical protein [uncultured Bradyrhizobium sp.]|uniref:hypothetical protein n=1 Tax=uncultured Bradyrhizobium sp. TaxID=199684 RepID=UPI002604352A|nr:hypothetical protein [uncultured Bradyrhizobium sp.]